MVKSKTFNLRYAGSNPADLIKYGFLIFINIDELLNIFIKVRFYKEGNRSVNI